MDNNYNDPDSSNDNNGYIPPSNDNNDVYGTLDNGNEGYNSPYDQPDSTNNQSQQPGGSGGYYDNPGPSYQGQGAYQNEQNNPNGQYMNNDMYNQQPYYNQPQKKQSNGKATASLVLGIISIVLFCGCHILSIILGIIGIVLAVMSREPDGTFSKAAKAGLITSIIGLVLAFIFFLFWNVGGAGQLFWEGFWDGYYGY